ncbi:MAG: UbiD family decarboxylase [Bacillati bacterium ANGP1]|uniref:UbiD family decarboxylase n=1 Tax=Candidatus Segetimicrobium genomatis TaxID=2569760 RepID=A0A537JLX6_9BACT|nr:MAG: UbiD family decarboxylase [Terrabacteria group bacterium ANGP1]
MAVPVKVARSIQSLRGTLEWLRVEGLLLETAVPVDPDLEVTGVQKQLDGSYPLLFENVKGYPHARAVTNLFANMDILDRMFGWDGATDRTRRLAHALTHPIPPVEVPPGEAPCQEEVITDDLQVNRHVVTIRHTELESERTIGSGNSVVVGPYFHGGSHIGYNRMNARWGNVCTFQSAPGAHMWQIITEHYHDERPIPLTMCFGLPPAATLIAGGGFDYVILPRGGDELGAAGAVQGFPIRIVKARTVDAWAVADCELVLEGHLFPRDKRYETAEAEAADRQGKFPFHPEWAGYMGKAYRAPTFHVTGITMRRRATKPIFYLLGVHMLDCNNIDTTVREAAIFELCERLQPGIVQDVNIPFCMTDWGGCIIQVKKRLKTDDGMVRNFLVATMATSQGMRLAIVVDHDVDIYNMDEIIWCLTTRVNPRADILNPVPGGAGQTFIPEERLTAGDRQWTAMNTRFEGGMAIDATVPFGYEQDFQRPVYPIRQVSLEKFLSADQIAKGKSLMRGWVEVLARTGR